MALSPAWRFLLLLALALPCVVLGTRFAALAAEEAADSDAETWRLWREHVDAFHLGHEGFLHDSDRFRAFQASLAFVRVHNARYALGEVASVAVLNYRAAFLEHERLFGHFQPALALALAPGNGTERREWSAIRRGTGGRRGPCTGSTCLVADKKPPSSSSSSSSSRQRESHWEWRDRLPSPSTQRRQLITLCLRCTPQTCCSSERSTQCVNVRTGNPLKTCALSSICGKVALGRRCPARQCCSRYGTCGISSAHCLISQGCDRKYGYCKSSATVAPTVTYCGPDNNGALCASGQCCGSSGTCGVGTSYCGDGCQQDYSRASCGTNNVTQQCGEGVGSCAGGQCCSQWGQCGTSTAFCGAGCLAAFSAPNSCRGSEGTGSTCGKGVGSCFGPRCCSQFGWCGSSDPYCGGGCQETYSPQGNCASSKSKPCGYMVASCGAGECCGASGTCGSGSMYCGAGCQEQYSSPASCAKNCGPGIGSCASGQCCSVAGYCGTGSAYCGDGCQAGYSAGSCYNNATVLTLVTTGAVPAVCGPGVGVCFNGQCCSLLGLCGSDCTSCISSFSAPGSCSSGSRLKAQLPAGSSFGFVPSRIQYNPQPLLPFVESKPRYVSRNPKQTTDWTNLMQPVQNQAQCSNCWAYAAVAAAEGVNAIVGGASTKLSEQQLTDCSSGAALGRGTGCQGGWQDKALEWVVGTNAGAMATAGSYPVVNRDQACKNAASTAGGYLTGLGYIKAYSTWALVAAVSVQPVVVAISSGSLLFATYGGGVINDANGCGDLPNHAVVVVGYSLTGNPRWFKVKNSWGTSWGEGGYARLAMTDERTMGMCAILATRPVYPVLQSTKNPCASSPCGDGVCVADSGATGGYRCTSCPFPFTVQALLDGRQTCASNPCSDDPAYNPCGLAGSNCNPDPSAPFGYTCTCPTGTSQGLTVERKPTCVGGFDGGRVYTVASGDDCSSIAANNKLTKARFSDLNPGLNCKALGPGQVVNVGYVIPNRDCQNQFLTTSGDTCAAVLARSGLTLDQFSALNPGVDCANMPSGSLICLEGTLVTAECGLLYMTQAGETCASIQSANNIPEDLFYVLNPGIQCSSALPPGLEICVADTTIFGAKRLTCTKSWPIQGGNTCAALALSARITQARLKELNPGLPCSRPSQLKLMKKVCINGIWK